MHHPLDRPVWSALNDGWAALADGDGRALRLEPDHGPFAAAADLSADRLAALGGLIDDDRELWIVEDRAIDPPPGAIVVRTAVCVQMVAIDLAPVDPAFAPLPLGEDAAAEMRALARLTAPGPFLPLTHRLGQFYGVRDGGRLIAMAGERMRAGGFSEVSGVCTHPDGRGRGLAGALSLAIAHRIVARGETPFLHCYAGNAPAVRLYRRLGFATRREVVLTILARDRGAATGG
jgi:ribosomal protein S18 acetylase RimI-like enzyme